MATRYPGAASEGGMAFREKRAWLALLSTALAYGIYFANVPEPAPGTLDLRWIAWFAVASLSQGAIFGLGVLWMRWRTPRGDHVPDERDRAIDRRAARIAYYVLMGEVMWVGVVSPLVTPAWTITQASLMSIVAAELVRWGMTVWSYRRGWHG